MADKASTYMAFVTSIRRAPASARGAVKDEPDDVVPEFNPAKEWTSLLATPALRRLRQYTRDLEELDAQGRAFIEETITEEKAPAEASAALSQGGREFLAMIIAARRPHNPTDGVASPAGGQRHQARSRQLTPEGQQLYDDMRESLRRLHARGELLRPGIELQNTPLSALFGL